MRVAIVGAGGFRTPLIHGVLLDAQERLGISEVVLHNDNAERIRRIQPVLDGLAAERGRQLAVRVETDLDAAVSGARFVLCAIRVGGLAGRVVDETVPLEHGVLGQETVGPGGIAFALRTLPAMRRIAAAVERHAPDGWLINFTNPAGLVTEALQETLGERAIGICDSPDHLCREVADALELPFDDLAFDYAGLNHLGWLLSARQAGRDLLPGLLADGERVERLPAAELFGAGRLRELGAVPNEYLFYYERPQQAIDGFRRAGATAPSCWQRARGRSTTPIPATRERRCGPGVAPSTRVTAATWPRLGRASRLSGRPRTRTALLPAATSRRPWRRWTRSRVCGRGC